MKLRNFTLRDKIGEGSFRHAQKEFKNQIPELVKLCLVKYGNSSIKEDVYIDNKNTEWILSAFSNSTDVMKLPKEFKDAGWGEWFPFAFDQGGWHFCINMSDHDYGSVYVNRWSDHKPKDQFVKIANSFEEFMNELKCGTEN